MLCLIFDIDDTLVEYVDFDFEEWYKFIAFEVAKKLNIPLTIDIWRGIVEGKIGRSYPEKFGVPYQIFWKDIDERNLDYRKKMLREGRLRRYEDSFVLRELPGIKIAWSSSSSKCVRFVLENLNLEKYFDKIYGKDFQNYRFADSDPKYRILHEIIKIHNCDECYVIGDSQRDMLAAKKAECKGIFVMRSGDKTNGEWITIKSLRELKEIVGDG